MFPGWAFQTYIFEETHYPKHTYIWRKKKQVKAPNPTNTFPETNESPHGRLYFSSSAMASKIAGVLTVSWTVHSGDHQRKHQSSASLAFARSGGGFHWWPMDSPQKGPVTRKMFPFDDVIGHHLSWLPPPVTERFSTESTPISDHGRKGVSTIKAQLCPH